MLYGKDYPSFWGTRSGEQGALPTAEWFASAILLGRLRLIDARADNAGMDETTAQGFNSDQGMVIKIEGTLYSGTEDRRGMSDWRFGMGPASVVPTRAPCFNGEAGNRELKAETPREPPGSKS